MSSADNPTETEIPGGNESRNIDEHVSNSTTNMDPASIQIKVDKKLPRSQRKRLIREQRRAKRKACKQGNAGQKAEKPCAATEDSKVNDDGYVCKKRRLELAKERCVAALQNGQRVCIDLSLEKHMNPKEHGKLAQQLCRLYGSNRQAPQPMHIYFSGFDAKTSPLYQECVRKNSGFEGYIVDMSEKSHLELFSKDEIVYLTPDSETVLEKVEADKVYVIGGLVDESITNNITNGYAKQHEIRTARLPIEEKMQKSEQGTFIKVLAVNQVFDILLELSQTGDWNKALAAGVPKRTGYFIEEEKEDQQ
jgi:tRNA (guanine9-N1)-methyltransferase